MKKARVNIQLLKTTTFDSGALGMLSMALHRFKSAGRYRAVVSLRGREITDVEFDVDEKSDVMQMDIDLAQAVRKALRRPDAGGPEAKSTEAVSPKGYVLFYTSAGAGYAVSVTNAEGKVVFDSARLGDGDLFAVSPLEPADYTMRNTIDSAAGEITVDLTPEKARKIGALDTVFVDVDEKTLSPARVELTSSQGLVFRIKSAARIVIEKKQTEAAAGAEQDKPDIHWRKFQPAEK
jgi:hypothetical protein